MAPNRSFTLNPAWSHYLASAALGCAILLGFFRSFISDRLDSTHCNALLSTGGWLDSNFKNWQPNGCMLHNYTPKDVSTCIGSKPIVFVGDSVTRQLFFQAAHLVDPTLPTSPPDDEHKHMNYTLDAANGVQLSFYWDPYLNSTIAERYIQGVEESHERPALLILGSGLWYLRYAESGGLPAWESKMENMLKELADGEDSVADSIIVLPVEDVVPSKLSKERLDSMRASDIDAMNSDLLHRLRPPATTDPYSLFTPSGHALSHVGYPVVFNKMLDASQTNDGLHFSGEVVKAQANILFNHRCNDVLPKVFPLDKTCCRSYPLPSAIHFLVLAAVILSGPVHWILSRGKDNTLNVTKEQLPFLVVSGSIALIYIADRTGYWLKEQKQFSSWNFAFLCILTLAIGMVTVKRADNDLGFLNRNQTDEWKGWMQIAILIYHYLGASKVSGIYNPIRVLVASYLFMTGYGHTTFYIKKADFGSLRVAQILVRLNLFTIVLAYTMNTDYISYYFSPLVSLWFVIIYGTMAVGSQLNDRTPFLLCKIAASMALVTWFMHESWLLETAFDILDRVFGIHWSAREWAFRFNLDLWIVYVGMLTSIAVIKVREYRLTDHPMWPLALKGAIGASSLVLLWFFAFELYQPDKFAYNAWHPYISFLPIGAFVILRNASVILRSASSRAFEFIGKCSLETFVIQYHIWLAGDTKGILLVIPGTRWRPLNMVLTTIIFIYVSHHVSEATGVLTKWICGSSKPATLPTVAQHPEAVPLSAAQPSTAGPSGDMLEDKGEHRHVIPLEPDTPLRPPPRRWMDRLAEGPSTSPQPSSDPVSWSFMGNYNPGVKTKLLVVLGTCWLLNLMWSYPV